VTASDFDSGGAAVAAACGLIVGALLIARQRLRRRVAVKALASPGVASPLRRGARRGGAHAVKKGAAVAHKNPLVPRGEG
jgi:hypothetical protein